MSEHPPSNESPTTATRTHENRREELYEKEHERVAFFAETLDTLYTLSNSSEPQELQTYCDEMETRAEALFDTETNALYATFNSWFREQYHKDDPDQSAGEEWSARILANKDLRLCINMHEFFQRARAKRHAVEIAQQQVADGVPAHEVVRTLLGGQIDGIFNEGWEQKITDFHCEGIHVDAIFSEDSALVPESITHEAAHAVGTPLNLFTNASYADQTVRDHEHGHGLYDLSETSLTLYWRNIQPILEQLYAEKQSEGGTTQWTVSHGEIVTVLTQYQKAIAAELMADLNQPYTAFPLNFVLYMQDLTQNLEEFIKEHEATHTAKRDNDSLTALLDGRDTTVAITAGLRHVAEVSKERFAELPQRFEHLAFAGHNFRLTREIQASMLLHGFDDPNFLHTTERYVERQQEQRPEVFAHGLEQLKGLRAQYKSIVSGSETPRELAVRREYFWLRRTLSNTIPVPGVLAGLLEYGRSISEEERVAVANGLDTLIQNLVGQSNAATALFYNDRSPGMHTKEEDLHIFRSLVWDEGTLRKVNRKNSEETGLYRDDLLIDFLQNCWQLIEVYPEIHESIAVLTHEMIDVRVAGSLTRSTPDPEMYAEIATFFEQTIASGLLTQSDALAFCRYAFLRAAASGKCTTDKALNTATLERIENFRAGGTNNAPLLDRE